MSDNKIKTFRKQQNLSQEQLAEKAQVSLRTIQRLEAGEETNTTTLNLVAGALGVEVSALASHDDSEQHQAKLADADEQLQLQLHDRHDEYKMYRTFYTVSYIIVMLAWCTCFPLVHNDIAKSIMGIFWIGGWIIFGAGQRWLTLYKLNPKLDQKYPLTVNRLDKNK